uniref:C-type lectin domain-containing protein n=1 Tax=Plectus sambesii TaxID=2011161 RepID=A0A914W7Y6_9BILA
MLEYSAYIILLIQIVLIHESTASLFSDECLRHGLKSYYDPTTDSCWIVQATELTFDRAMQQCNHMPGYDGHLAFPKTLNHSWIIYTMLSASDSWIGLQHFGSSTTVSNKSEWYWVYPDGRKESAADALWKGANPTASGGECAYSNVNNAISLYNTPCTSVPAKFICQYDSSSAHHETTLEHKCKQRNQWFWWNDDKSCLVLDTLQRYPEYSKAICTHIPGYRGHMVFIRTMEKMNAIIAFRNGIKNDDIWLGLERDRNMSSGQAGLFWRRFDGYKERFNIKAFLPTTTDQISEITANYIYMYSNVFNDWWDIDTSMTLCEYEETLRYAPTLLDIQCASLSLPHLYYQGSCYVREETNVVYDVAKRSCTHLDGFNGRLAKLDSTELLRLIYNTLTLPTGGSAYAYVGLERLNTTGAATTGYYWLHGNGQTLPVTDFSYFYPGFPTGASCGSAFLGTVTTYDCTTSRPFICEYVEPTKGTHFRINANTANMKALPQFIIQVYDDLSLQESCGYQCTKALDCQSIVYNANTRNCLLQSVDSGMLYVESTNIISAPGYTWYDRY